MNIQKGSVDMHCARDLIIGIEQPRKRLENCIGVIMTSMEVLSIGDLKTKPFVLIKTERY